MKSFGCKCAERSKPLHQRRWGVSKRNGNQSAFNGYHWTPSDYSTVHCLVCHGLGRTKASYVALLPDLVLRDGDWAFKVAQPEREEVKPT